MLKFDREYLEDLFDDDGNHSVYRLKEKATDEERDDMFRKIMHAISVVTFTEEPIEIKYNDYSFSITRNRADTDT